LIDLTEEDTVPYDEYFDLYAPIEGLIDREPSTENSNFHNPPIEVIDLEPPSPVNNNGEDNLEPLDPDSEYQRNINRMFITLNEYARNVYLNTLNE